MEDWKVGPLLMGLLLVIPGVLVKPGGQVSLLTLEPGQYADVIPEQLLSSNHGIERALSLRALEQFRDQVL